MAKIVLRDQIKTLGESSERFPNAKVECFLNRESEILDDGMRGRSDGRCSNKSGHYKLLPCC